MAKNAIEKQQANVLKAQERLGVTLVKEREHQRKRRDGRMLKLGVLLEQRLKRSPALLDEVEKDALAQFGERKIDRLDFGLDESLNYFDKIREEALISSESSGQSSASSKAPPASLPSAIASSAGPKTPPPQPSRSNGTSSANGPTASAPSSTAASA